MLCWSPEGGVQSLKINFSEATTKQLKSLRIGQSGGIDLPFVKSVVEQQFPNLQEASISQGNFLEGNCQRFFANLIVLNFYLCDAISDEGLEQIARHGNMKVRNRLK